MTTVNIPKGIHARLKALHKETRIPIGALVEMALESYLKSKEDMKKDADAVIAQ